MRKLFLFLFLTANITMYGQSQGQVDVIQKFMYEEGLSVLAGSAHITCTGTLESVSFRQSSAYGPWYDVKIRYTNSDATEVFTCSYAIRVGTTGKIEAISPQTCNSGGATCYSACNFWRWFAAQVTSDEKTYLEEFVHKALSEINCEEYALGMISYKWSQDGYSSAYAIGKWSISKPVSGEILDVWMEHNMFQDNSKGMKIHVKFNTVNMQSVKGKAIAYFYFKDGSVLKDFNNAYRTQDGQVSSGKEFTPPYESTTYNDLVIFMPYNELHLNQGTYDLKFFVKIYEYPSFGNATSIGESDYKTFQITQN